MPPTLQRVIRLDSLPIVSTYYTQEGYLKDRPVLTSVGIFEYKNPDGSIRRELRLPEEVFSEESLASYKGKPIIITHDAGIVTKENVGEHQIGTILTEGYRSGEDVRAEIVIHQTDAMKRSGLKELSLGYDLDLEETAGEWNGQPYDAIQRNIRINHLALVREARAGDQARLNIDSRDSKTILKGGKAMSKTTKKNTRRADGVLSPEELATAIEEYKARRAASAAADEGDVEGQAVPDDAAKLATADGEGAANAEPATIEEKVQLIKDRNDSEGEKPETVEQATEVIAQKDEDMGILYDIIDTLLAERDFGTKTDDCGTEPTVSKDGEGEEQEPKADEEGAAVEEGEKKEEGEGNTDDNDDPIPTFEAPKSTSQMNADAVDAMIRQRIQLGMIGRTLNLDGVEMMTIPEAKKAIVLAVRPSARFDGKSETYIDAMFDMAVQEVRASTKKDVAFQKKQMFNKDSRMESHTDSADSGNSAEAARQRMIERRNNRQEVK